MNRLLKSRALAAVFWFLLLVLFALPALAPLARPAPLNSADGLLHLYRLVELDTLWRQGIVFTRWLPDLAFGYGMPLFNYYAPLVYYLTTPLMLLGISAPAALNVSLGAALLVGAWGMFLWTRELLAGLGRAEATTTARSAAALVAALAFLYAPYILFDALYRGNLAEAWALALAPLALWRFSVLARVPDLWNTAVAAGLAAAVLLTHNVTGLIFVPLCAGLVIANGLASSTQARRAVWTTSLTALAGALALGAFFWLPALAEREYAQLARVIVTPDFDYRFNFVSPSELVALLPRADTGRLNPAFPSTLGVVQVALAIGGALALIWKRPRGEWARRAPLLYLGIAALALVGMMLAASQPIWDNAPLLAFVQLPMRLRGLIALCLAPLTAVLIVSLPSRAQLFTALAAVVLIVLSAFPLLYPRPARDVPAAPTLADMRAYEAATGAIGTTSFGEYLPVWVQDIPNRSPFAPAQGEQPNRFVIPPGVAMCSADAPHSALEQSACVSADVAWRALYRAFFFPGWQARVDGAAVAIYPNGREGVIGFDVPAGEHTLTIEYVGTPLETAANWISILAGVAVLGAGALGLYQRRKAVRAEADDVQPLNLPPLPFAAGLIVLALVLFGFKTLYTDRVSNPFVAQFDGSRIEGVSSASRIQFGDEMQLLASDAGAAAAHRGDTLAPTLYWRVLPGVTRDLSTFVHLTAPDGFVLAQKDNLHPANLPTIRWETDGYAADVHAFVIPASLAPGEYQLRAGVYDPAMNTRLRTPGGADYILIGVVRVEP